ncbi:MAG: hypothetical protein ACKOOL_13870 [Novosphingobium sp.]
MTQLVASKRKRGSSAGAIALCATVCALALPSAVLAFTSRYDGPQVVASGASSGFVPAEVDPRLARSITVRALTKGRSFRFTPAAVPSGLDRSVVTVAVRLNGTGTPSLAIRNPIMADAAGGSSLRIAPTAYSLGAARGYKSFAQNAVPSAPIRQLDAPDLASYQPKPGIAPSNPRFAPAIALDEREKTGRSPRTFEQSDQQVDLGGSYRVTRNLNVTAGVRYSSDRDRLRPLTDGRQDSQAVYVGTQFRF